MTTEYDLQQKVGAILITFENIYTVWLLILTFTSVESEQQDGSDEIHWRTFNSVAYSKQKRTTPKTKQTETCLILNRDKVLQLMVDFADVYTCVRVCIYGISDRVTITDLTTSYACQ